MCHCGNKALIEHDRQLLCHEHGRAALLRQEGDGDAVQVE